MDVKKEYEKIKSLFDRVDGQQLNLVDGALWEYTRLRVGSSDLYGIAISGGLVEVHPQSSALQKELSVSKLVVKTRANYLSYISKLPNLLGKNTADEDDDLGDYE